jgi:pyrroloquinoline quinone biosynthesis protein E
MADTVTITSDNKANIPLWLLAELSYACPLQCSYCSNPINYHDSRSNELSTGEWKEVLKAGRKLGAVQLGLSGGEPLVRQDLEELVAEARSLGYYSNLITSTVGADARRLAGLKEAGLDHIQVSFQGSDEKTNDYFAGSKSFQHKVAMAREVKKLGFPMVLNFVLHRHNIHQTGAMLKLSEDIGADFVELANTQYYGWALKNRDSLMPSHQQLQDAEAATQTFRQHHKGAMEVIFVVPDYFEDRPKACCNGWGTTFLTVTPDGTALPCQSAQQLPGLEFPNVREHGLDWIWRESPLFNAFRGTQWMQEPCRSCPDKEKDLGGCRCQAYLITGDSHATDPVCSLSPNHASITEAIEQALCEKEEQPLFFRNPKTAKQLR